MNDERNTNQITRKDARGCFVESLNDAFAINKAHLVFATYDVNRPVGERQTNFVSIYIDMDEFLDLCRQLESEELRCVLHTRKKNNDSTPMYECLGGTSAEKLAQYNSSRPDGKSLSRTLKLIPAAKTDFMLIADSGPGETNEKGLIVPKFGKNPENHVVVSLAFKSFSELLLATKVHYQAWLTAKYMGMTGQKKATAAQVEKPPVKADSGVHNTTPQNKPMF